jgi:hypothetical protein
MNIIVDRPQLVRVVLLYLNNNFGNLTPKKSSKHPNSVFYVNSDNKVMMEYEYTIGNVLIHYDQIWSKIESLFPLDYRDTRSILKYWLDKTYNLSGVAPITSDGQYWYRFVDIDLQF